MRLGKKDYKYDDRTIKLAAVLDSDYPVPSVYDFDKGRAHFPTDSWSNHNYGDCVIAGRTNHLLRLERVETRRTPKITSKEVVEKYFQLTGGTDDGLVVLYALKDWRSNGWVIPYSRGTRNYKIAAFGELNPLNRTQLRQSCYLLHGNQFGFNLPDSAREQWNSHQTWDVVEGPTSQPGSWGGHLVYASGYDYENFYIWTWGKKVKVTNAFIEKYCDEAWGVVDSVDEWRDGFDVEKLKKILHDIGASGIQ